MVERIYHAPHYPDLEADLVREIVTRKAADPLCRLLVLVPSATLRRRLAVRFAAEEGLSLLNVERLTFHQLASRLAGAGETADDFFFEEALRHLLRPLPDSYFSPLVQTAGGCAALWQTLRDLEESRVDIATACEALRDGAVPEETALLLDLYARWGNARGDWKLQSYGDVTASATARATASDFLKTFDAIFYYGFYDLTQVHVDLLQIIGRHHPVRLFIPQAKDEAWAFSQRFYERHLGGLMSASETVGVPSEPIVSIRLSARVQILPCRDTDDEVRTVAREIVRLVETEGIAYDEIGVVARDLTPYLSTLPGQFEKWGIPVSISGEQPLADFPYVHAVRLLLSLPRESLRGAYDSGDREPMAELLDSPYFSCDPDFDLHAAICALPLVSGWPDYVARWREILQSALVISPSATDAVDEDREAQAAATVMTALESLTALSGVEDHVGHLAFVDTCQRRLLATGVPWTGEETRGVAVLDAMSARGVCCRVLFIIGAVEGRFPRVIREDPFLGDATRRAVETTLGNKLDEKQAGIDEERLLFVLLAGSARERLYCLYPKSAAAGAAQTQSRSLDDIRRLASDGVQDVAQSAAEEISLIPPEEAAMRLRLAGRDVAPFLTTSVRAIYRRGCHAMAALASDGGLTDYDGIIGGVAADALYQRGLSPTGLVRYATCPFQFFASDLLDLQQPLQEKTDGIAPTAWGTLCHEILADYYRERMEGGMTGLREIADAVCARYADQNPVRFPLALEAQRERLIQTLEIVVEQDARDIGDFRPVAVEADCRGQIGPFPIRGRIDRIDQAGARRRIIDYKYSERKDLSANSLQLSIYRYLDAQQRLGQEQEVALPDATEAAFFYILPNRPQGPLKPRRYKPADAAEDAALLQMVESLEAGQFAIRPGTHCNNCGVATLCRRSHLPSRRRAAQDARVDAAE